MTQSSVGLWSSPLWGQHEARHVPLLTPSRVRHVLCHLEWQEIKEGNFENKYSNFSHSKERSLCDVTTYNPPLIMFERSPQCRVTTELQSYTHSTLGSHQSHMTQGCQPDQWRRESEHEIIEGLLNTEVFMSVCLGPCSFLSLNCQDTIINFEKSPNRSSNFVTVSRNKCE